MSTRALVGRVLKDGTVKAIYSHSEGYPGYLGHMLRDHYSDKKKLKALIKMGGASIIDENIGVQHDFEDYKFFSDNKQCRFYARDRGGDVNILRFTSTDEFLRNSDSWNEHNYLFIRDGSWLHSHVGGTGTVRNLDFILTWKHNKNINA